MLRSSTDKSQSSSSLKTRACPCKTRVSNHVGCVLFGNRRMKVNVCAIVRVPSVTVTRPCCQWTCNDSFITLFKYPPFVSLSLRGIFQGQLWQHYSPSRPKLRTSGIGNSQKRERSLSQRLLGRDT